MKIQFKLPNVPLLVHILVAVFFAHPLHAVAQPGDIAGPGDGREAAIYVANQVSNNVSVIDAVSFEVIATIPVGDRPHNVNHTPDGRYVLVTNKNVNNNEPPSLSVINTDTKKVLTTIEGLGRRIEHVVSPKPGMAYVSEDLAENAILAIDLDERSIVERVPVGIKPHGLWPSPDGKYLFVPNQLSGTLSKVETGRMTVVGESFVGRTPTMASVSPNGQRVYVSLYGERGLTILDAVNVESGHLQVIDVIRVGERPAQVAITPDGRYVLVPCEGPGAVYIISTATHEVAGIVPTGGKAHGVDVSTDSRYAFVTNWEDDSLSIVDLEKMTVARTIKVGDEPAGVDYVSRKR